MALQKKWHVVLDAENPPVCGDWIALSGLCPGQEETVRFLFLDGTRAEGFTFLEGGRERGESPSWDELEAAHGGGKVPWLHFPDCMEIVGVERQEWRPPSWPHEKALWRLTVVSLPSNIEFEKRLLEGQENRRGRLRRLFGSDPSASVFRYFFPFRVPNPSSKSVG